MASLMGGRSINRKTINSKLANFSDASLFVDELIKISNISMIGGFLRDIYFDIKSVPNDIDIVVINDYEKVVKYISKSEIKYVKNKFGGFKLFFENISVDLWDYESTWFLTKDKLNLSENKNVRLEKSVLLNIDGIVFNFNENKVYNTLFLSAIKNQEICINEIASDIYEKNRKIFFHNIVRSFNIIQRITNNESKNIYNTKAMFHKSITELNLANIKSDDFIKKAELLSSIKLSSRIVVELKNI